MVLQWSHLLTRTSCDTYQPASGGLTSNAVLSPPLVSLALPPPPPSSRPSSSSSPSAGVSSWPLFRTSSNSLATSLFSNWRLNSSRTSSSLRLYPITSCHMHSFCSASEELSMSRSPSVTPNCRRMPYTSASIDSRTSLWMPVVSSAISSLGKPFTYETKSLASASSRSSWRSSCFDARLIKSPRSLSTSPLSSAIYASASTSITVPSPPVTLMVPVTGRA
mmetsp:Transcript_13816/g.23422  ORF Transcript_13816/g.23422 Transcript_13816/m.23422 type:complete len:221 (+) Transcript_13816:135-797(+)